VHAGEHNQLNAGALNAAEYISPRILGYVTVAGKNAMKFGDCHCVRPGLILLSMSAWMALQGSGSVGGEEGIWGRR
jgi:hypothetical protein